MVTRRGPSGPENDPVVSAGAVDWPVLAQVCWQSSSKARRAAHAAAGRHWCPTRTIPYSQDDPTAARVAPDCVTDGCFDAFHDLLVEARAKLDRLGPAPVAAAKNVVAYTARLVGALHSDAGRRRRVDRGFAAKPGRSDGAAGQVIAVLRAQAPDNTTAAWWESLFRFVRDYAHTEGRHGTSWPVDGLTEEKTAHDHQPRVVGSPQAREEIAADIRLVLSAAERTVGAQWVHRMIWHPLMACVVAEPIDAGDRLVAGGDLEHDILTAMAHREYLRQRRAGLAPSQAFLAAGRVIRGKEPPAADADVLAALRELDTDLDALASGVASAEVLPRT